MSARRGAVVGVVAGVGLVAALARGDSPPDQYAIFQADTPTIVDEKTHLEWERYPELDRVTGPPDGGDAGTPGNPSAVTVAQAAVRCATFGAGWRLPTVKELLTLVDEDPRKIYADGGDAYLYIDRNAFPTAVPGLYWTSSRDPSMPMGWVVDFGSGLTTLVTPAASLYARCVHALP